MFISDKLIYLQLQKTGCTHIASLLPQFVGGQQVGKHGPLTFDPGERAVIGSIRNPWDWYVSLWSYGCGRKGAVGADLTSGPFESVILHSRSLLRRHWLWPVWWRTLKSDLSKDASVWRDIYSDSGNPELFRKWLNLILGGRNGLYLEDGYPFQPLADECGFLTFRFLRLFTDFEQWKRQMHTIKGRVGVNAFYDKHRLTDKFVKMDNLEADLAKILRELGVHVDDAVLDTTKTNASKRREYQHYYDDETRELVMNKDAFICDLFDYQFDSKDYD